MTLGPSTYYKENTDVEIADEIQCKSYTYTFLSFSTKLY